ncbi:MAG: helix-turn-helix domain-containing protein [Acidobacteriaceae bacterium]
MILSWAHPRNIGSVSELDLAQHLRALRSARGRTQTKLAEASGLHRTYISSVERCRRNVGLDNVERLAQVFGISVRDATR